MHITELIVQLLTKQIPDDSQGVVTNINFYTREDGLGYQGDCLDADGNFIKYMSYPSADEFGWEFGDLVRAWYRSTADEGNRWNKAQITVFRDGRNVVKNWWDQAYQEDLYSDGIWE